MHRIEAMTLNIASNEYIEGHNEAFPPKLSHKQSKSYLDAFHESPALDSSATRSCEECFLLENVHEIRKQLPDLVIKPPYRRRIRSAKVLLLTANVAGIRPIVMVINFVCMPRLGNRLKKAQLLCETEESNTEGSRTFRQVFSCRGRANLRNRQASSGLSGKKAREPVHRCAPFQKC